MEAVNHGNNSACLWLGSLYEQGKAIDSNIDMAHMLYQRGVDGGDEDCEFALARLLNASAPPPASGSTSIN
jgi:TPR repeat protein